MKQIELSKQLPVINMNFEEVKASLTETIEKYKGILVTEEGLQDCKATQKDLAGIRIKIDNYRKEIKKEMSKPITTFEEQCKVLIKLVEDAEKPIKNGIAVFDTKKKEEKRQVALDIIAEAVKEHQLNEKYASQLNVLDKYMNLTAKANDVKKDVEQRVFLLLQEQTKEAEMLQIIKDTIENANKNIDAKLSIQDFQSLINLNASPVKIIAEINSRAERIKKAELQAIADKEAKAERERQRIAKEAEEEAERIRIASLPKDTPTVGQVEALPVIGEPTVTREVVQATFKEEIAQTPVAAPKEESLYFVEMRVVGTKEIIAQLGQYLRNNNYNYTKLKTGAVQ